MDGVRFGINIPQFQVDSSVLTSLGKFATHTESLGFDSLWTLDGILHDAPFLEPLTSLAYAAALTNVMKLGTAVLLVPLRTPALLAQQTASIDFLSSGRVILGAALGGRPSDFAACGVPMKERVARFSESIKIMRMLWMADKVNFKGRFWHLDEASISPKPVRKGIPIWMGGSQLGNEVNEKAIDRAALSGDGWLGAGSTTLAAHERAVMNFVERAKKHGGDLESMAIAKRVYLHVDSDREKAKRTLDQTLSTFYQRSMNVEETCVYGTARACAEQLNHLKETGTKTIIFNSVAEHFAQAEIIARDVIPSIS